MYGELVYAFSAISLVPFCISEGNNAIGCSKCILQTQIFIILFSDANLLYNVYNSIPIFISHIGQPLHYAKKNWSWFLPADFMIDSEYFFIAEPEHTSSIPAIYKLYKKRHEQKNTFQGQS